MKTSRKVIAHHIRHSRKPVNISRQNIILQSAALVFLAIALAVIWFAWGRAPSGGTLYEKELSPLTHEDLLKLPSMGLRRFIFGTHPMIRSVGTVPKEQSAISGMIEYSVIFSVDEPPQALKQQYDEFFKKTQWEDAQRPVEALAPAGSTEFFKERSRRFVSIAMNGEEAGGSVIEVKFFSQQPLPPMSEPQP